ncbi:MAG: hypothetical protein SFX18_07565 [Pirellulales bacterium]|nr:hypothetical protein [Pirellulales bacterium]
MSQRLPASTAGWGIWRRIVSALFILGGISAIALNLLTPGVVSSTAVWSEEQARQHQEISSKAHAALQKLNQHKFNNTPQAAEAEEEFNHWHKKSQESQARLQAAKQAYRGYNHFWFWLGVAFTAIGVISLVAGMSAEQNS